jgi:hypothetical protein
MPRLQLGHRCDQGLIDCGVDALTPSDLLSLLVLRTGFYHADGKPRQGLGRRLTLVGRMDRNRSPSNNLPFPNRHTARLTFRTYNNWRRPRRIGRQNARISLDIHLTIQHAELFS